VLRSVGWNYSCFSSGTVMQIAAATRLSGETGVTPLVVRSDISTSGILCVISDVVPAYSGFRTQPRDAIPPADGSHALFHFVNTISHPDIRVKHGCIWAHTPITVTPLYRCFSLQTGELQQGCVSRELTLSHLLYIISVNSLFTLLNLLLYYNISYLYSWRDGVR
jgi:hypothetical protein